MADANTGTITLYTSIRRRIEAINPKFLQLMINRLIVGYYRYEISRKPTTRNYLLRARKSLQRYEKTGNQEFLMDAANYCMREFDFPSIPGAHYSPGDSQGKHREE